MALVVQPEAALTDGLKILLHAFDAETIDGQGLVHQNPPVLLNGPAPDLRQGLRQSVPVRLGIAGLHQQHLAVLISRVPIRQREAGGVRRLGNGDNGDFIGQPEGAGVPPGTGGRRIGWIGDFCRAGPPACRAGLLRGIRREGTVLRRRLTAGE